MHQAPSHRHHAPAEGADGNPVPGLCYGPRGIGTLEEFFEILTLKQLGRHQKPIAVLNIRGYFDALEELLEGAVGEGFLEKEVLSMYRLFREPEDAVRFLVKELEVLS